MRAKRSKVYKKAMALYTSAFKFREPFQVVVDAEFTQRIATQKLDIIARFENILGGSVKLMITQCAIARLYASGPTSQSATDLAKTFERRKCNHWQMKATDAECISGIMGDVNRFNYCVATQDKDLRATLRKVPGVPILFEKRGIVLLEPPSDASVGKRQEIEESKLHVPSSELARLNPSKSNSVQDSTAPGIPSGVEASSSLATATRANGPSLPNTVDALLAKKKESNKRKRGAKEANPLSVKKSKKAKLGTGSAAAAAANSGEVKGKGKGKENERPVAGLPSAAKGDSSAKIRKVINEDESSAESKGKATKATVPATVEKKPDPTKGVSRPEGDGNSKRALKRKAAKAEKEKAAGGRSAIAGVSPAAAAAPEKPKVKAKAKAKEERTKATADGAMETD